LTSQDISNRILYGWINLKLYLKMEKYGPRGARVYYNFVLLTTTTTAVASLQHLAPNPQQLTHNWLQYHTQYTSIMEQQ